VMGWLWWLAAAAVLYVMARLGWWLYVEREAALAADAAERTAIAARADQQHAWVLAGDPRGTFGENFTAAEWTGPGRNAA
jgi:hypothetical protein